MSFSRTASLVNQGYIAVFAVKEEKQEHVQDHPTVQPLSKI